MKPSAKRAFFTLGAENSGTRMLRRCLCQAGCYGDPDHDESTDGLDFSTLPDRIAIARSVPNGDVIPDVRTLAGLMCSAGYEVTPLLIHRKTDFNIAGQVKNYAGRTSAEARHYIEVAAKLAYELASWLGTQLIVVVYELFVTIPEVRGHLLYSLGLPPVTLDVFNANEKYKLRRAPLPF